MTHFPSTNTHSNQFRTDGEKIRFVRRYFNLFSDVQATEFHIEYHASPAGDTFDMRAAFLVSPHDCDEWLLGDRVQSAAADVLQWFAGILPHCQRWNLGSAPIVHQRPDGHAVTVVFRSEGIVLKRVRDPLLDWLTDKPLLANNADL